MILALLGAPITLISLPTLGKRPWRDFGKIEFAPNSPGLELHREGGKPAGIKLERLTGRLMLDDADAAGRELVSIVRWTRFLSLSSMGLLLLCVFEILCRLCRAVERGEIFTANNLKLVRRLGGSLVVITLVDTVIETWRGWRVGQYLDQHIKSEGLQTLVPAQVTGPFSVALEPILNNAGLFITGLLVLALAEVFRQGLVLKEETELTV